jgi:hypothetical protein
MIYIYIWIAFLSFFLSLLFNLYAYAVCLCCALRAVGDALRVHPDSGRGVHQVEPHPPPDNPRPVRIFKGRRLGALSA